VPSIVEAAARDKGIAIRGGCFCNPGAAEHAFEIPTDAARACLQGEYTVSRFRTCVGNRPIGAIRASVGLATTEGDVQRLLELVDELTRPQRPVRPAANQNVEKQIGA